MKTFLFVHNPNKWKWENIDSAILEINQKGVHFEKWSIRSHKQVSIGDRAFLMRLGSNVKNKGIIGSGYVNTEPFLSEHWSENGEMVKRVIIEFETLSKEPIISLEELQKLTAYNWTPQSSGIEITERVVRELEELWFEKTLKKFNQRINSDNLKEGAVKLTLSKRYERNPQARLLCIQANGVSCKICGFNFKEVYGELGQNYIHVHHIIPISNIGEEYEINPLTDLIPVCPNCHAMIHRQTPALGIEAVMKLVHNK